jgi:outer membrane biosynthesis protein TonB
MSDRGPYVPNSSGRESGVRWFMVAVSGVLHVALVGGLLAFTHIGMPRFDAGFRIAVSEVPLNTTDLPPLNDTREAGAPSSSPPPARQETVQPVIEEKKPEPEPEKPREEVKEPPKEEPKSEPPKPKPEPKKTETPKETVVSPNSKPVEKPAEPEPEPEPEGPKPAEVARELQQRSGSFSARRRMGSTTVSRVIASESDPGGGGGPALYRSVLIGRIGGMWDPPYTRRGEVRDAVVEFTIYSPPLARDAVNAVRTAQVTNVRVSKSSGDRRYDESCLEAVRRVRSWPPLPDSYRKETLVVQCRFYLIGEDQ